MTKNDFYQSRTIVLSQSIQKTPSAQKVLTGGRPTPHTTHHIHVHFRSTQARSATVLSTRRLLATRVPSCHTVLLYRTVTVQSLNPITRTSRISHLPSSQTFSPHHVINLSYQGYKYMYNYIRSSLFQFLRPELDQIVTSWL